MYQPPAYPIFWPTFTPTDTGYQRDWWYYDPTVFPEDQGPFLTREQAVSAWAVDHMTAGVAADAIAIDGALASLPAFQLPPRSRAQAYTPRTESGRALQNWFTALDKALDACAKIAPDVAAVGVN